MSPEKWSPFCFGLNELMWRGCHGLLAMSHMCHIKIMKQSMYEPGLNVELTKSSVMKGFSLKLFVHLFTYVVLLHNICVGVKLGVWCRLEMKAIMSEYVTYPRALISCVPTSCLTKRLSMDVFLVYPWSGSFRKRITTLLMHTATRNHFLADIKRWYRYMDKKLR